MHNLMRANKCDAPDEIHVVFVRLELDVPWLVTVHKYGLDMWFGARVVDVATHKTSTNESAYNLLLLEIIDNQTVRGPRPGNRTHQRPWVMKLELILCRVQAVKSSNSER